MALAHGSLRNLACQSCRQRVLKTFLTSIGGPALPRFTFQHLPHRTLTSSRKRWNETKQTTNNIAGDDFPINEINDIKTYQELERAAQNESTSESKTQSESYLPWYLQQQQPPLPASSSTTSTAQAIPPLPPNPPALLSPILSHLSIDLGMDSMTLLDLRNLDPPSALGASLIMLLATARSDKHLHVSADKFCRWLRTDYKLSPYADGLLGRAELKLKLKRRARRSRLLSAVGSKATADSELEEGIRTGWVCVDIGRIEGGELPEMEAERKRMDEGMVGFGESKGGSRVVVQMLTEEKRGEIDLERLWMGVARQSEKARRKEEVEGAVDGEGKEFRVVYEAETGLSQMSEQAPDNGDGEGAESLVRC